MDTFFRIPFSGLQDRQQDFSASAANSAVFPSMDRQGRGVRRGELARPTRLGQSTNPPAAEGKVMTIKSIIHQKQGSLGPPATMTKCRKLSSRSPSRDVWTRQDDFQSRPTVRLLQARCCARGADFGKIGLRFADRSRRAVMRDGRVAHRPVTCNAFGVPLEDEKVLQVRRGRATACCTSAPIRLSVPRKMTQAEKR